MMVNAGLNIYVLFKHPSFEDAQRQSAQKDISDFLAANPALAKRAVSAGLRAGTDFARENPGNILYLYILFVYPYYCVCMHCFVLKIYGN
jgi:hypothetical protein